MFLRSYRLHGDSYIELQKCERRFLRFLRVKREKSGSLFVKAEDFERFFEQYGGLLRCAKLPCGKLGFDAYGKNYYDAETAQTLSRVIERSCLDDHELVAKWLKSCRSKNIGFFVLGIE